jgi:hypothetical protein
MGLRDFLDRLLGRTPALAPEPQPEPEDEPHEPSPEEAERQLRWDAIQEHEKKVREREPDEGRCTDA